MATFMDYMVNIIIFLSALVLVYNIYMIVKQYKETKNLTKTRKNLEKLQYIQKKVPLIDNPQLDPLASFSMNVANLINSEIIRMELQRDLPSKSALHSKHKNNIFFAMKDLEIERLKYWDATLYYGYDPDMRLHNGEIQKLSLFVAQNRHYWEDAPSKPKPTAKSKPAEKIKEVKKNHLTVIK